MDFKFRTSCKHKSDEELMVLFARGKEKAFNEIYKRYSAKLFLFFYQKLYQDKDYAEDFLQNLFLKIIEKAHLFDTGKSFSSWIYTIAYNMCKNEYRKKVDVKEISLDIEELKHNLTFPSNLSNETDLTLFKKKLGIELNKLDEKHNLTFTLRYLDNLSIKEISEVMDCSEGTVKSRLFYTTKKLSKKLKNFKAIKI
ncbi:RNA polymerase sigma factor [Seonamhaeicola aphaedonensis]|uniref:RNA polymerase sigma-70 factor (ECF subfamily) n=1 Tax=Seonamhaeicola aphaedonensis TaxID=1461338 RepID=A0A3D9HGW9_9FLAO|nr:RNA polymerase sigma factor [Seonamhaeicola aphaedonensis]RED48737.1 RNA polymerase sigma-70 factor (ECF subfamily) [Seonamhaeicola aphaedonensis]